MADLLVTRGRLAVTLIEAGKPYRLTVNPWRADFKAWLFPLDEDTRRIATEYYEEIRQPLPSVLRKGVRGAHE